MNEKLNDRFTKRELREMNEFLSFLHTREGSDPKPKTADSGRVISMRARISREQDGKNWEYDLTKPVKRFHKFFIPEKEQLILTFLGVYDPQKGIEPQDDDGFVWEGERKMKEAIDEFGEEDFIEAIKIIKQDFGIVGFDHKYMLAIDVEGDLRIAPLSRTNNMFIKDKIISPDGFIKIKELIKERK